jgi:glycosyltransferase involved in cell wall biosynthesis
MTEEHLDVAIVIPCYRVGRDILKVIRRIDSSVKQIYVIDDSCPLSTGNIVEENCIDSRIRVIRHKNNQGVGGAVKTGYLEALRNNARIIVKLDGDGQMNPAEVSRLINPIILAQADYTKGNRFCGKEVWTTMPPIRLVGNIALTFISKISTGYWKISDPNNGFTAISSEALIKLNLSKISDTYFFESDMIFNLGLQKARIMDVSIPAIYLEEESSLKISRSLFEFSYKHSKNFLIRIINKLFKAY